MQALHQNKIKKQYSGGTSAVGVNLCVGRIRRCLEREHNRGVRVRRGGIRISRRIFVLFEEGIWWRRGRTGEGSGTEKVGARRENDGRVCAGI